MQHSSWEKSEKYSGRIYYILVVKLQSRINNTNVWKNYLMILAFISINSLSVMKQVYKLQIN